jgi:hypothetical protein
MLHRVKIRKKYHEKGKKKHSKTKKAQKTQKTQFQEGPPPLKKVENLLKLMLELIGALSFKSAYY